MDKKKENRPRLRPLSTLPLSLCIFVFGLSQSGCHEHATVEAAVGAVVMCVCVCVCGCHELATVEAAVHRTIWNNRYYREL